MRLLRIAPARAGTRLDPWLLDLRAAVHRPQIVLPFARSLCELMNELEAVAPELRAGTLVEAGLVAPPAQDTVLERDAGRVEILKD
jgi:hypothetical protein